MRSRSRKSTALTSEYNVLSSSSRKRKMGRDRLEGFRGSREQLRLDDSLELSIRPRHTLITPCCRSPWRRLRASSRRGDGRPPPPRFNPTHSRSPRLITIADDATSSLASYHPLPVVFERAEGALVWDPEVSVSRFSTVTRSRLPLGGGLHPRSASTDDVLLCSRATNTLTASVPTREHLVKKLSSSFDLRKKNRS